MAVLVSSRNKMAAALTADQEAVSEKFFVYICFVEVFT